MSKIFATIYKLIILLRDEDEQERILLICHRSYLNLPYMYNCVTSSLTPLKACQLLRKPVDQYSNKDKKEHM